MTKTRCVFDGKALIEDPSEDQVADGLNDEHGFVWLDVDRNARDDLLAVAKQYDLHPLGVESALSPGERPQLSVFPNHVLVEFYGIVANGIEIDTQEISLFIGDQVVVTVRNGELPKISTFEERVGNSLRQGHVPSPGKFLYAVLDELVDGYFDVVDGVGDAIDNLETLVIEGKPHHPSVRIHELRKTLLTLERLLRPERDVLLTLTRREMSPIGTSLIVYFDDVYDHLMRMLDLIDSYRDEMATLYDVQFAITSNQLNQTMRTLTAASIILMATTLVASVYGMNFHRMPELGWSLGYPFALGLMLVIAVGMFAWFRWRKWV